MIRPRVHPIAPPGGAARAAAQTAARFTGVQTSAFEVVSGLRGIGIIKATAIVTELDHYRMLARDDHETKADAFDRIKKALNTQNLSDAAALKRIDMIVKGTKA